MVESIFDTGGSLRAIGHCNHHRRHNGSGILPRLVQDLPVLAQQIIRLCQQIRQRLFRLSGPVDVVFHGVIRIDMIQLGTKTFRIRYTVIPHHNTGRLYQPRLNAVVQAKIADDPAK